jgi:hypothetical protein
MNQDTLSKDKKQIQKHKGFKSIRLPFSENAYQLLITDKKYFKLVSNKYISEYEWL